jgi:hypothetical protein
MVDALKKPFFSQAMKQLFYTWTLIFNGLLPDTTYAQSPTREQPLLVHKCDDFLISGNGDHAEWKKAEWHSLNKLDPQGRNYDTRFKILYSAKGVYVLFSGQDNKVATKYDQDFGDLFNGDVFEVFFQPDPKLPLYLEYEINQLSKELVLLIPNINGSFFGWIPWRYEKERTVKKAVIVVGGKAEAGASIQSWTAELFFPNELLQTVVSVAPASGAIWNANFYRLDYDSGSMVKWAWSPVKTHFHEMENFRPIKFE